MVGCLVSARAWIWESAALCLIYALVYLALGQKKKTIRCRNVPIRIWVLEEVRHGALFREGYCVRTLVSKGSKDCDVACYHKIRRKRLRCNENHLRARTRMIVKQWAVGTVQGLDLDMGCRAKRKCQEQQEPKRLGL